MGRKNSVSNTKDEGVNNPAVLSAEIHNEAFTNEVITKKLAPYLKTYPGERVFYITSDGQVFLEKSINDAENHQRFIDSTKEVISFERE